MGEYKTDADSMDALRAHLKAIRTESARIEPKPLSVAISDAREQLTHPPELLPERLAALNARLTARLEELEGTVSPRREPEPAADSPCSGYVTIADATYDLAHDATDFEESAFWYQLYLSALGDYADCMGL